MKSFNDLRHKTMSRERIDRNRSEAIMSHPHLKPIPYYKSWRDREVDKILYDDSSMWKKSECEAVGFAIGLFCCGVIVGVALCAIVVFSL